MARALLPAAVVGLSGLGTARAACSLVEGACICEDAEGTTWDVTELTASGTADAVASGSCSGSYCSGEFEYFIEICGQLTVPSACNFGMCCSSSSNLNLMRIDTLNSCPPSSICQCDQLGMSTSPVTATALDDGSDTGLSLEYTPNSYYQSYVGWVSPVVNLICDSSASTTEPETEVVNAPGCTTNYCSVTINWRTPVVCSAGGGSGWTITILICVAAGLYVSGGVGYTRYSTGHFPGTDGDGGLLSSHPHYSAWGQVPGLVQDGVRFTRGLVSGGGGGAGEKEEFEALAPGDGETPPVGSGGGPKGKKKVRRKSEPGTAKKKRKKKPRPSVPVVGEGGDGAGKE